MTSFPQHLLDGYRAFTSQRLPTEQTRYRELSERGQSPAVMVIGCCDSRVSPEVIFDAGPGELFVVRNVANLVPVFQPDGGAHGVSAALEYAVQVLRIKHIVVLGHAQCGGIRAFIDDIDPLSPGDFIGRWMAMFIKPGEKVSQRERETRQDFTTRIEKAAVFRSLENLMTFPFVRSARRARRDEIARRLFRRRRGLAVRARPGGEGIPQRQGRPGPSLTASKRLRSRVRSVTSSSTRPRIRRIARLTASRLLSNDPWLASIVSSLSFSRRIGTSVSVIDGIE